MLIFGKIKNKSGVSMMVSYVLLVSIALAVGAGVYVGGMMY